MTRFPAVCWSAALLLVASAARPVVAEAQARAPAASLALSLDVPVEPNEEPPERHRGMPHLLAYWLAGTAGGLLGAWLAARLDVQDSADAYGSAVGRMMMLALGHGAGTVGSVLLLGLALDEGRGAGKGAVFGWSIGMGAGLMAAVLTENDWVAVLAVFGVIPVLAPLGAAAGYEASVPE